MPRMADVCLMNTWGGAGTWNWYKAWLPNSEAANRKPVLSTQTEVQGGRVSKYLIFNSVTLPLSAPSADTVTL